MTMHIRSRIALVALLVFAGVRPTSAQVQGSFDSVRLGTAPNRCTLRSGTGTPEGAVTGSICDVYLRSNGSTDTTIYVKESGTGNTGWIALISGTYAPIGATYLTQTANGTLTNEQAMGALGTGIVKNTTTTGVQSIAIAADFPTLNQNTTGNAATVTTNANLTGPITSTGNATAVASQTGTGSTFVMNTAPTLATSVTVPLVIGGTSSAGNLTFNSTSHATKGNMFFGAVGVVDEANTRFGIGTLDPGTDSGLVVAGVQEAQVIAYSTSDKQNFIRAVNANAVGVNAAAVVGTKADTASMNFQSHGSGRVAARFGVTLGGYNEFLSVTGSGLVIGTLVSAPVILGTNSLARLFLAGAGNVGVNTNAPGSQLTVNGGIGLATTTTGAGDLTISNAVPTISSAFGTSPSVTGGKAAAFRVNVGTGGAATGGVIAMNATATNGWNCDVHNLTALAANRANQWTVQTASTATTVTVQNQTISTGAALAWTASDILTLTCVGF